ncbi:hypothetical protein QBC44DRAFT_3145 [Cladorrhinum sp. PSN332]|nr:hypothetical protein QBC44DRAFT_3145 [Cladorrhinum sp. PSN332]
MDHARKSEETFRPFSDLVMYQAIRLGTYDNVKMWLELLPEGPFVLCPPYFEGCECTMSWQHGSRCVMRFLEDRPPMRCTPIHPVVHSIWVPEAKSASQSQEAYGHGLRLLRQFIDRGEDVNAQCGPEGTAIHAVVQRLARNAPRFLQYSVEIDKAFTILDELFTLGADIHAENSQGLNPLELFWERINDPQNPLPEWRRKVNAQGVRKLIRYLLDHGAVYRQEDADGKILDTEVIKNFGVEFEAQEKAREEEEAKARKEARDRDRDRDLRALEEWRNEKENRRRKRVERKMADSVATQE